MAGRRGERVRPVSVIACELDAALAYREASRLRLSSNPLVLMMLAANERDIDVLLRELAHSIAGGTGGVSGEAA
jgi:hypothetical protein